MGAAAGRLRATWEDGLPTQSGSTGLPVRTPRRAIARAACAALALSAGTAVAEPGAPEQPGAPGVPAGPWAPLEILGKSVAPGEKKRVSLAATESYAGASVPIAVSVARGVAPGPTLCLMGGVHGDELNGIEIVRRSLEEANPEELAGTLVGAPIVNVHGFRHGSRYLPDRRDLNRFFPGSRRGSSAARIAFALFDGVIRRCDALVDLHSGSFWRTNLAQVRGDLENPGVMRLARGFGGPIVLHHAGRLGTLRRAAVDAGIPAVTYEAGEPTRFQREEIERGVAGVKSLERALGMIATPASAADGDEPAPLEPEVLSRSRWVRVDDGGILTSEVRLGDRVATGSLLGRVIDPIDGERAEVRSPFSGLVIGMAQDQLVIPGFAAYHLATAAGAAAANGEIQPVDAGPPADSRAPDGPELDERPE